MPEEQFVSCDEIRCQFDKSYVLELPWPDRRLSPNAREHWSTTARHKRAYRARCRAIGESAGVGVLRGSENAVSVHLTFFPPDRRARDMDNMLAAMKSGLDGLADAMGVDDSKWKLGIEVSDPVKGGIVLVQVRGG